ncbi:hypothetical protein [Paraburkholderia heleia]|uniref:hypothetical protein n=1 Tax=Paraburkholderia heleia TaxID=634127 RepID=UPI0005A97EB2|nr:hypothetical protein [Paraburkholderia heleia]
MSDQEFDDFVRRLKAVEVEIDRCDATVRALWTELTRLARLGVAASMAYQQLTEVESNRQRLILQREEIRLALADAGR